MCAEESEEAFDLTTTIRTGRSWFNLKAVEGTEIENILLEVEREGYTRRSGDTLELTKGGRVALVLAAMRIGQPSSEAAQHLGPSEFEDLVSHILGVHSFEVMTRVRLRNKSVGAEFDVVGWKEPRAVFIDCKRWPKRAVYSTPCRSQRDRVETWGSAALSRMGLAGGVAKAFPMVVTVVPGVERCVEGCLLIGVDKLDSAVGKLSDGFLDQDSLTLEF